MLDLSIKRWLFKGAIAEYPATSDNFIYMCRNAL